MLKNNTQNTGPIWKCSHRDETIEEQIFIDHCTTVTNAWIGLVSAPDPPFNTARGKGVRVSGNETRIRSDLKLQDRIIKQFGYTDTNVVSNWLWLLAKFTQLYQHVLTPTAFLVANAISMVTRLLYCSAEQQADFQLFFSAVGISEV